MGPAIGKSDVWAHVIGCNQPVVTRIAIRLQDTREPMQYSLGILARLTLIRERASLLASQLLASGNCANLGCPAPSAPPVLGLQGKTCSSFLLIALHPIQEWEPPETRCGSQRNSFSFDRIRRGYAALSDSPTVGAILILSARMTFMMVAKPGSVSPLNAR